MALQMFWFSKVAGYIWIQPALQFLYDAMVLLDVFWGFTNSKLNLFFLNHTFFVV